MEWFETVDDLGKTDLDELTTFLDKKGRNFANSAAKAKAIRAAARDSYRLPNAVNNSVNQAIAVSIASMRALEKQVKVLTGPLNSSLRSFQYPDIHPGYRKGLLCRYHRRNR